MYLGLGRFVRCWNNQCLSFLPVKLPKRLIDLVDSSFFWVICRGSSSLVLLGFFVRAWLVAFPVRWNSRCWWYGSSQSLIRNSNFTSWLSGESGTETQTDKRPAMNDRQEVFQPFSLAVAIVTHLWIIALKMVNRKGKIGKHLLRKRQHRLLPEVDGWFINPHRVKNLSAVSARKDGARSVFAVFPRYFHKCAKNVVSVDGRTAVEWHRLPGPATFQSR